MSGVIRPGLIRALVDPGHQFAREEVAALMATAFRWGYEQRADEEQQGLVAIDFSATDTIRDLERKALREESDRDAREGSAERGADE